MEREKILRIIKQSYQISLKAKKEGLLSLSVFLDKLDPRFSTGIKMVMTGIDPHIIDEYYNNLLFSIREDEKLTVITIHKAVRYIQDGTDEEMLNILLSAIINYNNLSYIKR